MTVLSEYVLNCGTLAGYSARRNSPTTDDSTKNGGEMTSAVAGLEVGPARPKGPRVAVLLQWGPLAGVDSDWSTTATGSRGVQHS
jgi:hypothetical protein